MSARVIAIIPVSYTHLEGGLTALDESDGAPMFELCAYDIDGAAANQKDILARWQALMEGEAP